jgi:hypothetical protein
MKWEKHKTDGKCKVFVGKPEEKRPVGLPISLVAFVPRN